MSRERLRTMLIDSAVKYSQGVLPDGSPSHYTLDFREAILGTETGPIIRRLFLEKIRAFKAQTVGALTVAGTLLASSVSLLANIGGRRTSAVFFRYRPKQKGLLKIVEGDHRPGEKIVIFDDIIRENGLVFDAVRVAEENGYQVEGIVAILCRDMAASDSLRLQGIRTEWLFSAEELCLKTACREEEERAVWKIGDVNMAEFEAPRSAPALLHDSVVFGTNESRFICASLKSGRVLWSVDDRINNFKAILSSPLVCGNKAYYGAYNGCLYCVNKSGKVLWKRRLAEWIGSSPFIHENTIYFGAEFGNKNGALVACDMSGRHLWHIETGHYIHSSPGVCPKTGIAVVGCNDFYVYAAKDKKLLWKKFVEAEVKMGFCFDERFVYFGSHGGELWCLETRTGKTAWKRKLGTCIYSTPELVDGRVLAGTLSKRLFVLDRSGKILHVVNTEGAVFGHTTVNAKVHFGCTGGFFYVLDLADYSLRKQNVTAPVMARPLVLRDFAVIACRGCVQKVRV